MTGKSSGAKRLLKYRSSIRIRRSIWMEIEVRRITKITLRERVKESEAGV